MKPSRFSLGLSFSSSFSLAFTDGTLIDRRCDWESSLKATSSSSLLSVTAFFAFNLFSVREDFFEGLLLDSSSDSSSSAMKSFKDPSSSESSSSSSLLPFLNLLRLGGFLCSNPNENLFSSSSSAPLWPNLLNTQVPPAFFTFFPTFPAAVWDPLGFHPNPTFPFPPPKLTQNGCLVNPSSGFTRGRSS